ncbi:PEP-CTERM system histidine kinase PrsK [Novosphingobium sp. KCTC 2891]|uniref:XrtA/PEP-CTERM system histidine kinase PrsK n=1 Tax=Novosphingobium sp. KCTC 2891 TaxID=2989730 RepID=UPI0022219426|nr:XrtA/PEP-CTERM system histidine kinase PrsK [Novosphingobium sp. KCTC 2891]MCW1381667.1 PEP-CTERM system histidine kinase PrsK [Novosphingobium sp. KCTC 2891]
MLNPLGWAGFGQWTFLLAAFGAMLLAVWLSDRRRRGKHGSRAEIAALVLTALWSLLAAGVGQLFLVTQIGEVMRNLGWLLVVYALFARDGRHESVGPVRPVLVVLALLELFQPVLLVLNVRFTGVASAQTLIFQMSVMFRLLLVTGALVLVHNLYAGAMSAQRGAVRWICAALALVWGYDLNYYTIAYLGSQVPAEMAALRGLADLLAVMLLTVGALRGQSSLRFSPSRTVAFQSLSLLVIGGYMIVMVAAAQSLAWLGGNVSQLAQMGFAFATTIVIIALVPSRRLRGYLNVMLAKHFFQHRYDYRAEWLRFTRTVGRGGAGATPLHDRVVQAVADITDSARGLLLVPGEQGELVLAARWQWPTLEVPAEAMAARSAAFFERRGFIVDLDEIRAGIDHEGESALMPGWMIGEDGIWALVPLLHFDRLVGLVVLGHPPLARKLDWEDFDLLRVVGQQLASYLAEHNGQVALLEASRFDEFNRRIAFVMHDIKNLASQLALLSRNAERHADNPEFRKDMLVTLRNAADKLNALLARLSRYGAGNTEQLEEVDGAHVVRAIAARYEPAMKDGPVDGPRVYVTDAQPCKVLANRETLEQVLLHLVQNAIDASPPGMAVFLQTRSEGLSGYVEVIDTGSGMSADFVRNRLFKPFVSTKAGGFGIGAFEARELVTAMRGRLDVESREGLGSRFTVRLPLAATANLIETLSGPDGPDDKKKVA